jgi:hypothetical protein
MKDTQPPITSDEEYAGSLNTLADIDAECLEREQDVFQARSDPAKLNRAREGLYRMYRIRQGILDALRDYERSHPVAHRQRA